jgi:hypothetical protein
MTADPTMRAGRNGFIVLLVALLVAWAYQFALANQNNQLLFGLWALGAVAFYASKYYYDRTAGEPA